MRLLTAILLFAGVVLFGVILSRSDLSQVWEYVRQLGWLGVAAVLGIYCVSFTCDISAWSLTFRGHRTSLRWLSRLWRVQMVGEALNNVTPLGSLGGEPVKAALLNRHYGIGYRESAATLVLAQTIAIIAQILFMSASFVLMLRSDALDDSYRIAAGGALFVLCVLIGLFFGVQRFRVASRTGGWLGRGRMGERLQRALGVVEDVEDRLVAFYVETRGRFAGAVALQLINWMLGALEIYVVLHLLGYPVAFTDAWLIEGTVVLVRSALFLVPGSVGTQEATFLIVCGAITGSPDVALAMALIRRARELLWVCLGLLIGWAFSLRKRMVRARSSAPEDPTAAAEAWPLTPSAHPVRVSDRTPPPGD